MLASKFFVSAATRVVAIFLTITLVSTAAFSDDRAQWQFSESNDPDNKGRTTARLILGVPETDSVQFSGVCSAVSSTRVKFSVLQLSADVGEKKDGEEAEVLFSGGGFGHVIKGEVFGTKAEVGITGILIRPEHNDKLWTALIEKNELDYVVPGYRATALKIGDGKAKIKKFIEACRVYAEAVSSSADNREVKSDPAESNSSPSGISEKEAFDNAKDLNTIEGWEAFLNSYNTGFRADLARAYVKRLAGESRSTSTTPSQPTKNSTGQTTTLNTIDPGPGTTPWVTGKKRLRTTGNKAVYSASVRANGVELVTYCVDWNQTGGVGQGIFAVLREYPPSTYPEYSQRIQQALEKAQPLQGGNKKIRVLFASGFEDPSMSVRQTTPNGELMIGSSGQAISQGQALTAMMTEQSMTVFAPPFSSTIQLTGSRPAICRMANRCGAAISGCDAADVPAVVKKKKTIKKRAVKKKKKKKKKNLARTKYDAKRGCRRGTRYVGGKCRGPGSASEYCGPGYAPRNGKCTQGASYNF